MGELVAYLEDNDNDSSAHKPQILLPCLEEGGERYKGNEWHGKGIHKVVCVYITFLVSMILFSIEGTFVGSKRKRS